MRDAVIERVAQDFALGVERPVVAEVVPKAQRDRRQQQPGGAHAPVGHRVIAFPRRHPRVVGEGDIGNRKFTGHKPIVVMMSAMQP